MPLHYTLYNARNIKSHAENSIATPLPKRSHLLLLTFRKRMLTIRIDNKYEAMGVISEANMFCIKKNDIIPAQIPIMPLTITILSSFSTTNN